MLRNPREGKVGEAVADFPLKFPQQSHLFTRLFHVQTQGHTHQKQLILLWMHRRVGNKPPRQGGGSSSMKSAGSCSLKRGAPTPRNRGTQELPAGISQSLPLSGGNGPFLGWTEQDIKPWHRPWPWGAGMELRACPGDESPRDGIFSPGSFQLNVASSPPLIRPQKTLGR